MDKHFSANRPDQLWVEIQQIVAKRAEAEAAVASQYAKEETETEQQYQDAAVKAKQIHAATRADFESRYASSRKSIIDRYDSKYKTLEKKHRNICDESRAIFKTINLTEKQKLKDAQWEAHTVFEATKDEPKVRLARVKKQLQKHHAELGSLTQQAEYLLVRRDQKPEVPELSPSEWPEGADPNEQLKTLLARVQELWGELVNQRIPSMFEGGQLFMVIPLFLVVTVAPVGLIFGWTNWIAMLVAGTIGMVVWGIVFGWLYRIACRETIAVYIPLRQAMVDVEQSLEKILEAAKVTCQEEEAAVAERLRSELEKADKKFAKVTEENRRSHTSKIKDANEHYPPRLENLVTQRETELEQTDQIHTRQMEQFGQEYEEEVKKHEAEHVAAMADIKQRHEQAWEEMALEWRDGMQQFEEEVDLLNRKERELFFDWSGSGVSTWEPTDATPHAVPFGRVTFDLADLKNGISKDERLASARTKFVLPALFPFPDQSILLTASGKGREKAVETIQAVMLRLLTGTRPGKVRFTILDPVGLGEGFSAFMHLADFDEQVITSRIWTEGSHIEQQLVNLTEHMENVIQVYLRNEFETIQQYNEFAGEMAEPYRVLVVANFPANFSETSTRRLKSIIASGARCGVYVLMSVDRKVPVPHGFELGDLEAQMLPLDWKKGRFVWKGSTLSALPLELDAPPEPKTFTELVRTVGERISDADRVEVPFDFVVPKQEDWWNGDSARELTIPLGRAGAMKLQNLNLGRGTAQHVLVAGKTGSGKSNLLHAIITNIALWYSPDQVELYLVDFKKGVEFKPYAEYHLPHAKVIAVESEREFGLSVLERLDAELKERGDRFRQTGVQDLAGWRRDKPDEKMPRVVLVIDEFQELFVEDDRIAQNAALLLDRLVRQGRAFGMHVLLGSQTLAGAYSLPRATIGQMAVRIALQCGEADAHLILSEENTAARLLTRPGEAIYNDANGLYEGNHPFQVVWLPDHDRTHYLKELDDWTGLRNYEATPPIVFEGNAAADPRQNWLLEKSLASSERLRPGQPAQAWLGSAVAIKDPTAVTFRRQGGSNLLVVGHNEESALGLLGTSLISLAAQVSVETEALDKIDVEEEPLATFYLLDGMRPEAPEVGFWKGFSEVLPHRVQYGSPRETAATINRLAVEMSRRQEENIEDGRPIYLVVYDLGRFRELRREEDSFRFSSMDDDAPPKPSAQFAELLREGPSLGIHVLVWCDTCNTLNRWVDRQSIHDFEMRVAFQMSGSDSSMLIDSADAGRIGTYRAIYYDEGLGQIEKFRPYGMPDKMWLDEVKSQLGGRG